MITRVSRFYYNGISKKRIGTCLASYPSSVPLPVSGSVCDPPLPLAPPPLKVLGSVAGGFSLPLAVPVAAAPPAPGLTAEVPGLAVRSLRFNKLLNQFCKTSCCVGLGTLPRIGDVGAPESLPRPPSVAPLLPSISANARSTVGSEKDDEHKGPTRPAAGVADASVGVRKMPRGSRSARRAFSS
jgi:hypothetical protein